MPAVQVPPTIFAAIGAHNYSQVKATVKGAEIKVKDGNALIVNQARKAATEGDLKKLAAARDAAASLAKIHDQIYKALEALVKQARPPRKIPAGGIKGPGPTATAAP